MASRAPHTTLRARGTSPQAAAPAAPQAARGATLRARGGFTLVELLAATLVLVIVTMVVSTGVTTAMRTYTESQYAAQSELLAGNIENVLDGTVRYMRIDDSSGTPQGTITYHGTEIANARLQVHDDGLLYFDGDGGASVKLLNASVFNHCTIDPESLGDTGWMFTPLQDAEGNTTGYEVSGGYTIVSADGTMTRNHYFTYVPLASIAPVQVAAPEGA